MIDFLKKYKKFFLLSLILFIPLVYYLFHYIYEKNNIIFEVFNYLTAYVENHLITSIFVYSIIIFIMVLLNLPGGSIRAIIAGYFFGTFIGSFICVFFTTLSSYFLFIFYKKNLVIKSNLKKYAYINKKLTTNLEFNFLVLRLVALVPLFIQNLLIAQFKISKFKFIFITALGIYPINLLYSTFGATLKDLNNISSIKNINLLLDFKYLIFVIFTIIIYTVFIRLINIKSK